VTEGKTKEPASISITLLCRRPGKGVIFCLIILAFSLSRLWRRTFYPFFPSAVRAVAARCKLPFALRPGLSQERVVAPQGN